MTASPSARFVLRRSTSGATPVPAGAWWPSSRVLADELDSLFASWPGTEPSINRVLFSPPDWDDCPRKVLVNGSWVKAGHFPRDDTHVLTLTLSDGSRRALQVIDPATPPERAALLLDADAT